MRTIVQMSFISLSLLTLGLTACHAESGEDVGHAALASGVLPNTVLILDGAGSGAGYEAMQAASAGFNVEVVSPAVWSTKTTADFAEYKAILIGAMSCFTDVHDLDAAVLNAAWGPAVTGNVIVVGEDPGSHVASGANLFSRDALRFAAAGSGTGAYVGLGCYYFNAAPLTPVPVLAPLGSFTVKQPATCYEDAHRVASHPTMTLVTDASLSSWHCSARELIDGFPATFQAHVIVEDVVEPGATQFLDHAVGIPYVVSRGVQARYCGDAEINDGEECDDGNHESGDGCSEDCRIEPFFCGDWSVDPGEQCDDGNHVSGDGCSATCQLEDYVHIGACCLSGGGCQEALSPDDCTTVGGAYTADALTCSQVLPECPQLLGACCLPKGGCVDSYTDTVCQSVGGGYLGTGTKCEDDGLVCGPPPPTGGACCLPQGSCIDGVDAMKCAANAGAYFGVGTTCATYGGECKKKVTGACCVGNGCSEMTADECASAGGSFAGVGAPCDATTCPGCTDPVGACCVDSQCLTLSAAACQTNGGLYAGDGSMCMSDTCGCDVDDDGTAARAACSMTTPGAPGGGGFLAVMGAALMAVFTARRRRARVHAAR